jgi:2-succinyl-6-hydroxy-2,4-cyclohexadiene-1-carboxylate synthase
MIHFHFLHGFLGLPIDWGPLMLELKTHFGSSAPQFHLHNLWKDMESLPDLNLKNWGLKFAQKLPPSGNVLIGFSLGGRLAMHFPVWEQRKLSGMVLISAHTGLTTEEEKKQRAEEDQQWAEKFSTKPWEIIVREWNAQAIFSHDRIRPPRKESDFSRPLLSKALTEWSLSRQENMVDRLKEFQCPIYYFFGDKDEKFANLAKNIQAQHRAIRLKPMVGGHCPQFSNPSEMAQVFPEFTLSS